MLVDTGSSGEMPSYHFALTKLHEVATLTNDFYAYHDMIFSINNDGVIIVAQTPVRVPAAIYQPDNGLLPASDLEGAKAANAGVVFGSDGVIRTEPDYGGFIPCTLSLAPIKRAGASMVSRLFHSVPYIAVCEVRSILEVMMKLNNSWHCLTPPARTSMTFMRPQTAENVYVRFRDEEHPSAHATVFIPVPHEELTFPIGRVE